MSYDTLDYSTRRRVPSLAVDRIDEKDYQMNKLVVGGEGTANEVSTAHPLPVTIVSGGGGGSGGTEFHEDAAHTSGDLGTQVLAVRNDAGTSLVSTTGDYAPLQVDSTGALRVTGGGGGTQYAEDAAHVSGDQGTQMLAVRNDAGTSLVSANGDYASLQVDSTGALRVTGGGGGSQYAEDVASAGGENMTLAGAIRQDTPSATTSTDGDYSNLKVNNVGRLYTATTLDAAIPTGSNTIGSLVANQSVNAAQINGVAPLMGNGASGTGAQRVTIANDSTGILAAVTNVATIGTSVTPGTGATNLGKAEDAAHTSGDVGVLAMGVRQDADSSPVSATGDYQAFLFDAVGNLKVNIKAGAGSGGTALADNATFTRGTTSVTPIAGVVETSAPTLTNGNTGTVSLTTGGAMRVSVASGGIAGVLEDAASAGGEEGILAMAVRQDTLSSSTSADGDFTNLKVNAAGSLYVTGSSGTTQYTEDAASAGAESLCLSGAVRQDTIASSTSADGDYGTLKINNVGRLYTSTTIDAALPTGANTIGALTANQSVNVAQINGVAATMGNGVAGTGVQRVTIASDSTGILAAVTNVATIGTSVTPGTAAANLGKAEDAAAASGDTGVAVFAVRRDAPSSDVSAAGDYATIQVDSTGQLWTRSNAQTTGGYTPTSTVSAASTNATSLKASAGTVGAVTVTNINAAMRYLKFYNKASAPTVGTDTPVYVMPIPGNTAGAGATIAFPCGLNFSTGIAWALTTGPTVADTGAVAASEIIVSIASI